jgi:DNA-binding winged helix-turn-helix (wHTH) protein
MRDANPALGEYAFDRFVVQPAHRQLLVDGQPARLGARAFDLLLALVERRDRLVSKNELLDLVWPNQIVEENNLQVQISALRKLLGRTAIATIPGRGYRFTAGLGAAAKKEMAAAPPANGNEPRERLPLIGRGDLLRALLSLVEPHPLVAADAAFDHAKASISVYGVPRAAGMAPPLLIVVVTPPRSLP